MERLTMASNDKYVHCNIDDECTGMCGSCRKNTEIRHKLKHYEDLEEQGLLKTVVRGEWIPQDETFTRFMCSQCKGKNYAGYQKFCPNCGAEMKLKEMDGES